MERKFLRMTPTVPPILEHLIRLRSAGATAVRAIHTDNATDVEATLPNGKVARVRIHRTDPAGRQHLAVRRLILEASK